MLFKKIILCLTACVTAVLCSLGAFADNEDPAEQKEPKRLIKQALDWVVEPNRDIVDVFVSDFSKGAYYNKCAVICGRVRNKQGVYVGERFFLVTYDLKPVIDDAFDGFPSEAMNKTGLMSGLYMSDGYSVFPSSTIYNSDSSYYISEDTVSLESAENSWGRAGGVGGVSGDLAVYDEATDKVMLTNNYFFEESFFLEDQMLLPSSGACCKGTLTDKIDDTIQPGARIIEDVDMDKIAIFANEKLVTDFVYTDAVCTKIRECPDKYKTIDLFFDGTYVAGYKDKKWDLYDENGKLIIAGIDGIEGNVDANIVLWPFGKKQPVPYMPSEGYVAVKKNGKYSFVTTDGELLYPYGTFEDVRPVHNGMAWVKYKGGWGVLRISDDAAPKGYDFSVNVDKTKYYSHVCKYATIEYNDDYRSDDDPCKGKAEVYIGKQMFSGYNATKYNKEIATLSAALCAAASDGGEGSKYFGQGHYIVPAYKALGVKDKDISLLSYPDSSFNEDSLDFTDDNDFAFSIAMKDLDGEKLIMITLRGTETSYEAVYIDALADSIFGGTTNYYGYKAYDKFLEYADDVKTGIGFFVNKHKNELSSADSVKILLTGHSLGGAAANLMGASLDNELPEGLTNKDVNVFVYTFGALNSIESNCTQKKYSNIWNIFNYYDTFGPYGPGIQIGFNNVKPTKGDKTIYHKFGNIVPFKKDYTSVFEHNDDYTNHVMAGYYAAVKTGVVRPEAINSRYFRIALSCPIDVQIIDCDGEVVAEVRDGKVNEEATIFPAYTLDAGEGEIVKNFLLPNNGSEYYFRIIGTDDGTMDLFAENFDNFSVEEYQDPYDSQYIESVTIEEGKELFCKVGGLDDDFKNIELTEDVPPEIKPTVEAEREKEQGITPDIDGDDPDPDEDDPGEDVTDPDDPDSKGSGKGKSRSSDDDSENDSDSWKNTVLIISVVVSGVSAAVLVIAVIVYVKRKKK